MRPENEPRFRHDADRLVVRRDDLQAWCLVLAQASLPDLHQYLSDAQELICDRFREPLRKLAVKCRKRLAPLSEQLRALLLAASPLLAELLQ